jgi:hypothetical protein
VAQANRIVSPGHTGLRLPPIPLPGNIG